jgi:hypothetical protein
VLERLDLVLDHGFRLGAGTGATLMLALIVSHANILRNIATFASAGRQSLVEGRAQNQGEADT